MERIGDAGAGFRSITEAIDTTTPAGRMMCAVQRHHFNTCSAISTA
jgi:DNA invertase Pin-like site-specific DNA recombinase